MAATVCELIQRWTIGEGGFIGEASLIAASDDDHRIWSRDNRVIVELTDVYVHPLRRRNGWARECVQTALDFANAEEWDVFLRVAEYGTAGKYGRLDTVALAAFYGRMGFNAARRDSRVMIKRWQQQ